MVLRRSLWALTAPENRERLRWAVRVRWLVIVGFFVLALAAERAGRLPSVWGCVVAAVIGAAGNGVNHWSVLRWRAVRAVSLLALLGDVVLISWVVVDTGGLRSPFVMMYVVQVVATAMLVDLAVAALCALACVSGFVGFLRVQRGLGYEGGWLPVAGAADAAADHLLWALFLLYCLGLLVYLGGYISDRLRASERDLAVKNARLREALASLGSAHADLAATVARLQATEAQLVHAEKLRALGEFVAGIAHELNNPLSYVSANVEHLRLHLPALGEMLSVYEGVPIRPAERARLAAIREERRIDALLEDLPALVADCQDGVRRAQAIVSGLRTFARGERGEAWQLVDLDTVIDEALALLRHRLPDGVSIERAGAHLPPVECRPGQLSQVFVNLLANAADAVGSRGRITIRATVVPPGDGARQVAVAIGDDGTGVRAEILPHVFEPFFTTKEVGRGVGLGLSISHGIVRDHGGEIRAESCVGAGSTFTVVLPIRRAGATSGAGELCLTAPRSNS